MGGSIWLCDWLAVCEQTEYIQPSSYPDKYSSIEDNDARIKAHVAAYKAANPGDIMSRTVKASTGLYNVDISTSGSATAPLRYTSEKEVLLAKKREVALAA